LARRLLRQHFAAQCYLQTPTLLCVMPILVSLLFAPLAEMRAHFSDTVLPVGLASLSLLWLLAAETVYLQRDLSTSRGRAFSIALGSTLLGGVIVTSLIAAAAHVAHKGTPAPAAGLSQSGGGRPGQSTSGRRAKGPLSSLTR
jgi:hypothetical protein